MLVMLGSKVALLQLKGPANTAGGSNVCSVISRPTANISIQFLKRKFQTAATLNTCAAALPVFGEFKAQFDALLKPHESDALFGLERPAQQVHAK